MNAKNRCQIYLKWFLKNTYFYCATKKDFSTFEFQAIDPSIATVPAVSATPAAASTATAPNVDLAALMQMRKDDWAFHFFKQNAGTKVGAILPPSKCKKVDNVNYFDFVRSWWFDNKEGKSDTGTAPQFLRVINDDICLCPQCREGFEKDT